MMMRSPIVATNVDAILNLIKDRRNGLLISEYDYKEVANVISKLYDNEELILKLTKNAYNDLIRKFDIKLVAKNHENLLRELLL